MRLSDKFRTYPAIADSFIAQELKVSHFRPWVAIIHPDHLRGQSTNVSFSETDVYLLANVYSLCRIELLVERACSNAACIAREEG
jgi:hypothetical protein